MIIGFDFDKVFIDYPPLLPYGLIDFLYKGTVVFKKGKAKNDKLHYRFPGVVEQKIRIISHYSIFRNPIKENIGVLRKISGRGGNKTYLVSSRFSFLKTKTEEILKKYDLNKYFDGIYFNFEDKQPHLFKEQTIKNLKIDTYIDDDLDLSLYLAQKMPNLTIYWVRDGRKKEGNLPKNVIAIKDLKELYGNLFKK